MTIRESPYPGDVLKSWQQVTSFMGILAIFAVIATVTAGFIALGKDDDTSSAMKLPATIAFLALWGFAHAKKKILAMRMTKQIPESAACGTVFSKGGS